MSCNRVSKQSGFTLIEALFSIGIAGVVLTLLFSYFTQSVKSVAHNEDTLETIREINKLTTQLRRDLYHLAPYKGPGSAPIDLKNAPAAFPLKTRYYPVAVRRVLQGNIEEINLNPIAVSFRLLETDDQGRRIYARKREMDGFFDRTIGFDDSTPIADGIVSIKREIRTPLEFSEFGQEFSSSVVEVQETYLHTPNEGSGFIFYRYFPPPFAFVQILTRDFKQKEVLLSEFGKRRGKGRLRAFEISPVFHYVKYEPAPLAPSVIEYNRFWIQVDLVFAGDQRGTGPESRTIPVQFKVENSYLNSNKWKEGLF